MSIALTADDLVQFMLKFSHDNIRIAGDYIQEHEDEPCVVKAIRDLTRWITFDQLRGGTLRCLRELEELRVVTYHCSSNLARRAMLVRQLVRTINPERTTPLDFSAWPIDLTRESFGIDEDYICRRCEDVVYVHMQPHRCQLLRLLRGGKKLWE